MSVNCLNHAYQCRIAGRKERLECLEPWDERPSGIRLEDIQPDLFACACRYARDRGRLAQSFPDRTSILHATGLARGCFLTNSGAVLFSDTSEPFVSCRFFSGGHRNGLIDSVSYSGPYVCALEGALFFVAGHCRHAFGGSIDRMPSFAAWLRSVTESLLSYAFLHRSYEVHCPVRVSMESGRLLVSFPREQASVCFDRVSFRPDEGSFERGPSGVAACAGFFSSDNALLVQNAYRFGFLGDGPLDRSLLARECCEWGFSLDVQDGARDSGLLLTRRATRIS